jgi:hypothetical protein
MIVVAFVVVALAVSYELKKQQNDKHSNGDQKPKGFFNWLLEEFGYKTQTDEYPKEQKAKQDLSYSKNKQESSYYQKPKKTKKQHQDLEHLTFSEIAPAMVVEEEQDHQEKSELFELFEQDSDILKKLVLGDIIMTPKVKKGNYRKIF